MYIRAGSRTIRKSYSDAPYSYRSGITVPSESSYDIYTCFRIRIHQGALDRRIRNISHRRFHLHFFSRQGRVAWARRTHSSRGPCSVVSLRVPLDCDFRSRARSGALCVLKVSPIIMTNVRPQSENYSFRDRLGEGPHGNAGVKSTTGTNLTYLVIGLTLSADTRDLLNNDDDALERPSVRMTVHWE